MTETILVEQEIEPGETERVEALFDKVEKRRDDGVVEVLQKEGVYTESAFLRRSEKGDFVLYYIEAEDVKRVYEVYRDVVATPNAEAAGLEDLVDEFTDVMAGEPYAIEVDPLYHLVAPDRP